MPIQFIEQAARAVAQRELDYFADACKTDWEYEITSPIERILYAAILATARINGIKIFGDDVILENGQPRCPGLSINPQHKIGKYRIDFAITYERKWRGNWEDKRLLIECDSQQFHERSEAERRYEKRRDRYLISQGYTILHFTGSEIVQNPWSVAAEILEAICLEEYLRRK